MTTTTSPWFTTPGPGIRAAPALPLFCLPHAGAGPAVFRAWPTGLDERVDVVAVQYPGRAARIAEPAEESIRRLAERIAGALVAFELARVLSGLGRPPRHLVVSGQTPPHHYRPTGVHALPDDEFREAVVALAGTEPGVLASPTLWDMLLPILRADFRACETYEYTAGPLLTTDLTVVSGDEDPTVDTAALGRWAEITEGRTSVHVLPGGHFYLTERPAAVLDVIGTALRSLLLESP
jgi:surfactin synthase thioesterase subunit